MLFSIGEILVDIFDDGEHQEVHPGGAPFNFACNALQYTRDVSFFGAIGEDDYGMTLLSFASQKPFVYSNIKVLKDRHTTKAIVTLKDGERSFKFDRELGADYCLDVEDIDISLIKDNDIVHLGSLMLSHERGVKFFNEIIKQIKTSSKAKISFDINYRSDIFKSPEVAKKTFIDALKMVDIIKFSLEDIELLMGTTDVVSALKSLVNKDQIAIVSLGKEGSMYYKDGHIVKAKTYPVKPIDTTGAGDAFYSYILSLLSEDPFALKDDEHIKHLLLRANVAGGLATLKKGAIHVAPTEYEIDKFLSSFDE
ncbi:MAG: carbohydrate kinase [Bacilli bacterium]|nr:carbohydrate kinase [Bacilli bacterium]